MQHHPAPKVNHAAGEVIEPRALVRRLLKWYRTNARDLPWRRTHDPYAIWISEIMLQQTRVKSVIPYWKRWMRALPTVRSLARARPEKVLKLWEGLGYYTRARNLLKAAQTIVTRHGGRFPMPFDSVLALPGIGRYTAGAICSIAFNQPSPVLDGNVIRVLARVFGIADSTRAQAARDRFWKLADSLVGEAAKIHHRNERSCACLNQALMELGATVCTPRQPACARCPIRGCCAALRDNRVEELPNRGRRIPATQRRFVAFVVNRRGRFLVRQRPADVVNARLWEFPNVEVNGNRPGMSLAAKQLFGSHPLATALLHRIRHSITRYRITIDVYRASYPGAVNRLSQNHRWCSPAQLDRLPFPSAHRRIAKLIADPSLVPGTIVEPHQPRTRPS